jgi:hypothetical protein
MILTKSLNKWVARNQKFNKRLLLALNLLMNKPTESIITMITYLRYSLVIKLLS